MALASRARATRIVGVVLDEGLGADRAVHPGSVGFRQEYRGERVVARHANPSCGGLLGSILICRFLLRLVPSATTTPVGSSGCITGSIG